jgi:hypothetical protein
MHMVPFPLSTFIETLRYTRARDHEFYAAREGRGDRPRVGGSVAIEEQVYREDAPGNAVVARAPRWRPQVNGRRNDNKSNLLGRAEFTRRPRASKRSILEGYTLE